MLILDIRSIKYRRSGVHVRWQTNCWHLWHLMAEHYFSWYGNFRSTVFRSNGDWLDIKGGPVSKFPPACEPKYFWYALSLNLLLAWCVIELVRTCCLHIWIVMYHIFAFHANYVLHHCEWQDLDKHGMTRNVPLISACTVQSFVHCPHRYLAHGMHMVWSLYIPKELFVQVWPFRIHCSCVYIFICVDVTHWRSSMDAGIKWPHFAHEKATGSESFVAMYVQADPCLKIDVVYSELFFGGMYSMTSKGPWPWYVHKTGLANGTRVCFFGGEGKPFNQN